MPVAFVEVYESYKGKVIALELYEPHLSPLILHNHITNVN